MSLELLFTAAATLHFALGDVAANNTLPIGFPSVSKMAQLLYPPSAVLARLLILPHKLACC